MGFFKKLQALGESATFPKAIKENLLQMFPAYQNAIISHNYSKESIDSLFINFIDLIIDQIKQPFPFDCYHQKIISPFNYYQFGLDFIKPLVNLSSSKIYGLEILKEIDCYLKKGENIIFLANHQIEADPQVISILLESTYPEIAEEIISVAGNRVTEDPVAIPFSLGRNLICIYSKKHIDSPPEKKEQKQMHNMRALKKMASLLDEGGKCIYVAPSGGRDRPNALGEFEPDIFDPQSIDLFFLISKKAHKKTHFYPLALLTHSILPPPKTVEKKLGEMRLANIAPVFIHFGQEVDLALLAQDLSDKKEQRKKRAEILWHMVKKNYNILKLGE